MDVYEIRRHNLVKIYEHMRAIRGGGFSWASFAKFLDKNASLLSQYKSGKVNMGDSICKHIEVKCDLPPGHMSSEQNITETDNYNEYLTAVFKIVLQLSKEKGIQFEPDKLADFVEETYQKLAKQGNYQLNEEIIFDLIELKFS